MDNAHDRRRELLRRVKAAGIPVADAIDEREVPPVLISQDFQAYDGEVFDFNGGAGLILPLKIVSNLPVFVFIDFSVELDRWTGAWFYPVEEVEDSDWPRYEFSGRSDLKFNRDQVINRFITEAKALRPGYPMRGLLLAFSVVPMPDDLRRGEVLDGMIRVYDQFGHKHSTKVRVRAERQVGVMRGLSETGKH